MIIIRRSNSLFNSYLSLFLVVMVVVISFPVDAETVLVAFTLLPGLKAIVESEQS